MAEANTRGGEHVRRRNKKREISRTSLPINLHFSVELTVFMYVTKIFYLSIERLRRDAIFDRSIDFAR